MDLPRLFGSRVRAEILLALASTPAPQSGYRLARAVGAQPIQVLTILRNLEPDVKRGPAGWTLQDEGLRIYLRGQLALRDRSRREEKDALLVGLGLRPSTSHGRV